MQSKKVETRWILALLAAFALVLGGCPDDEEEGNGDTGGGGNDVTEDTTEDTTPDMVGGDMTDMAGGDMVEDTAQPSNYCVNETDTPLVGSDEAPIRAVIGGAVNYCATQVCLACASNPECDLPDCVATCITDYEDGDSSDADVDAAVQAVRDSGLTADCTGCYAGITGCILQNSCAFGPPGNCATDRTTCGCQECQCDAGCGEQFAACSGLETYLTCDALTDGDGNACE